MSTQSKLFKILETESYNELDSFSQPATWKKMTHEERALLGLLFIKQAAQQIEKGDKGVFESCEIATKVSENNPMLYYQKGLIFASQTENMRCLLAAAEAFQKGCSLAPHLFDLWYAWANTLYDIGMLGEDLTCFEQANEKFQKAHELVQDDNNPYLQILYWRWGMSLSYLGNASGEPGDLLEAREKFLVAEKQEPPKGQLFNDFGNLYASLGHLLPTSEFAGKAIEYYRKATQTDPKLYDAWLSLGCTLALQYQETGNEDDFLDAHQVFEKCVEIDSSNPLGWVRWGHLLACAGKMTEDLDRVYASFEKFEAASLLEPDMPRLLLHWGESLLVAGVNEERLDLLKDAEAKIARAIRSLSTAEEAWIIYGRCLCELGNYFDDVKYFQQSIEKFQHALEQFPGSHGLAIGLAHTQISMGDETGVKDHYEAAIKTFEKNMHNIKFFSPGDLNEWGVAWMKLAEMTQKCEHATAAVEKFEQAITLGLQHMTLNQLDSSLLYNYGAAVDFLGDFHNDVSYYEKAVQALAHVVAVDENHPYAKYNLALALYHRAEFTADVDTFYKALEIIEELAEKDPEDDVIWNQYGTMLLTLADLSRDPESMETMVQLFLEAERCLYKAIACGSVVAHYNLACLYALAGNRKASVEHLELSEKNKVLPPVEELLEEEWLDSLHDMPEFRNLIGRQYIDEEGE